MARFSDVDVFLAVASAGSFRRAAHRLEVTKSTVSRAVARLEAHLGAPLFVRDQRALRLTEAGLEYRAFAAAAAAALDEGERAVEASSGTIRGTLRVSAPRALGEVCVAEMLGAFLDRHPQVSVELALSDDLVRFSTENVDVAIRAGRELPDSDLSARRLARCRIVAVATPERAAALDGSSPIPLVDFSMPDGTVREAFPGEPRASRRFRVNDYLAMRRVILSGRAVGVLSELLVARDLRAGRLVRVERGRTLPTASYWALYGPGRRAPAKVRALVDHLALGFASQVTE